MFVRSLLASPPALERLLIPVALLASAACGGPAERPVDELVRMGDVYLEPESMEPFSGLAFATFEGRRGAVAERRGLGDGGYAGPYEALFENRRLSSKELYQDGVKHGRYEWYFENGQLFEEGTYVEGRLDGPYRAYWENGELYEEGTYREGRFDGARRWYLDGRLIELVTYRNGVMDGIYERYREDGTLDLKGMLKNGSPCGMWIESDSTIPYPACSTRLTD